MSHKEEDHKLDKETEHEEKQKSSEPIVELSEKELEDLNSKIKELEDKNLRLLAELENTRKRLQKEKLEMQSYAKESLACEFLTPIDQFANALGFKDQQPPEVKDWMVGFEMILAQFKDVLSQNEIYPIDAKGYHFDPFFHEAMEMEETEEFPENTVIHEFVKGYKMGDRVIRPAKVKVAKAMGSKSQDSQEEKKTKETTNNKEG